VERALNRSGFIEGVSSLSLFACYSVCRYLRTTHRWYQTKLMPQRTNDVTALRRDTLSGVGAATPVALAAGERRPEQCDHGDRHDRGAEPAQRDQPWSRLETAHQFRIGNDHHHHG